MYIYKANNGAVCTALYLFIDNDLSYCYIKWNKIKELSRDIGNK